MHLKTFREKLTLFLLLALAIVLRIYGQNWDSGFHLHPDERMLIMVTTRIHFFTNLNPDFFNYGSLPIYMLAASAQFFDTVFKINTFNYDGLLLLGRTLSTIFDIFTLFVVFKISRLLFNKVTAFFSIFVYAVAFFPIQNAHFFVVDPFLTFFLTATLYVLLLHNSNPSKRNILLTALFYAMALATKVSAIVVYPIILAGLLLPYYIQARAHSKNRNTIQILISTAMKQLNNVLLFHFSLLLFHFSFMPFAYIEATRFLTDISLQAKMNTNPYIFPYTLQYVGTIPYLYYLKNIFLWGLGPVFSILACLGCIQVLLSLCHCDGVKRLKQSLLKIRLLRFVTFIKLNVTSLAITIDNLDTKRNLFIVFFCFYLLYFIVLGKSAVKFMRYMLPLYPFFALCAGIALSRMFNSKFLILNSKLFMRFFAFILCLFGLMYSLLFMHLYTRPNTRVQATAWIAKHVPPHSVIAIEHWDDQVPLAPPPGYYTFLQLPLYNQPDDTVKWKTINTMLDTTDYVVIASNRLYVPISHLANCKWFAVCFPIASKYYVDLFSEKSGFVKVKEFVEYPQLAIGSFKIKLDDQRADESFTVYDHPKIMIFKKK